MIRLLLILLALCGATSAATVTVRGPRIANSTPVVGGDIPSSVGTLLYRWRASDLTMNGAVSNWVDSVSGRHVTQATGANQPTNSSQGVHFWGSQMLGVTNVSIQNSNALFMVVNLATPLSWRPILGVTSSETGIGFENANNEFWLISSKKLSTAIGANTNIDVVLDGWNFGNAYTNGAFSSTNSSAFNMAIGAFGGDQGGGVGDRITGFILEICIYRASTLTSVNVSNLHYYSTNTYGGFP